MYPSIRRFLQSRFVTTVVTLVLAVAAAVSGVYVGRVIVGDRESEPRLVGPPPLGFGVGDPFPPESYLDASGATGAFYDLPAGTPTAILFVRFPSESSERLMNFWVEQVAETAAASRVRVVLCRDLAGDDVPTSFQPAFPPADRVSFDLAHFQEAYYLYTLPAVVALDSSGTVTFVQVGFDDDSARERLLDHFAR